MAALVAACLFASQLILFIAQHELLVPPSTLRPRPASADALAAVVAAVPATEAAVLRPPPSPSPPAWVGSAHPQAGVHSRAELTSPPPSAHPPSVALLASPEQARLLQELMDTGESVGGHSTSKLCVVMPVRGNTLAAALRNVRSWSSARAVPCAATATAAVADLCIFHSQSFAAAPDARLAAEILRALEGVPGAAARPLNPSAAAAAAADPAATDPAASDPGPSGPLPSDAANRPRRCLGAVRFLAARIPIEADVYTIYPTHNFSGPNNHFLRTFDRLHALSAAGVARYSHYQQMEPDVYPFRAGWLSAIAALARGRGKEWVRGSRSQCLRKTEVEHVNGNALYSLERNFVNNLRRELAKRFYSWAFDVLLGHWLFRAQPNRIAQSHHVLSISTFQRNRSCCELVRRLVIGQSAEGSAAPGQSAEGSRHPGLYLLHTGNIGKLPDSSVPPSMRSLALHLQDPYAHYTH